MRRGCRETRTRSQWAWPLLLVAVLAAEAVLSGAAATGAYAMIPPQVGSDAATPASAGPPTQAPDTGVVSPGPVGAAQGGDPSGAFRTSVPIEVPPYHGLEPHLSLTYRSNGTDSWTGVGWALSGISYIQRLSATRGVPHYDDSDIFLADGLQLVPCGPGNPSPSCRYPGPANLRAYASRPESFQRFAFDPQSQQWFIWAKNGTMTSYTADLTRTPGATFSGVYRWHADEVHDTSGNGVKFFYAADPDPQGRPTVAHPTIILYNAGNDAVHLYYEPRPDPITFGTGDTLYLERERLRTIDVVVGQSRARAYALSYAQDASGAGRSLLHQVQQYGSDAVLDASGRVTGGSALPAVQLDYRPGQARSWSLQGADSPNAVPSGAQPPGVYGDAQFAMAGGSAGVGLHVLAGDVDGDGRTDLVVETTTPGDQTHGSTINLTTRFADGGLARSQIQLPTAINGVPAVWGADVNGDGRMDLIFYVLEPIDPNDPNLLAPSYVHLFTALSRGDGTFALVHAAVPVGSPPGDGTQATNWIDPSPGTTYSPNCQVGDVNGDGRADFVCTYQDQQGIQYIGTALSRGDGFFDVHSQAQPFLNGHETRALALGDTRGTGRSDVLVMDFRPDQSGGCDGSSPPACHYELVTALSRGDGQYDLRRTVTTWPRGQYEATLSAADLNGDGRADFFSFAGRTFDSQGNPLGTIQTAITQPDGSLALHTQPVPWQLASTDDVVTFGDVNGDGRTDLLMATALDAGAAGCSSSISYQHVLLTRILSNGDGTFTLPQANDCTAGHEVALPWSQITRYSQVRAADVNGDGLADFLLAFVDSGSGNVTVHDDVSAATGLDTMRWTPADVTGDGRQDLVYVQPRDGATRIETLLSQPDGTYRQVSTTVPVSGNVANRTWKLLDVNGDGRADLVQVQSAHQVPGEPYTIQIQTLLAGGDGTWQQLGPIAFSAADMTDVPQWRPAVLDANGRMGLVAMSMSGGLPHVETLRLNGDGTWARTVTALPPLFAETDLLGWQTIDINGDGLTDLVHVTVAPDPNAALPRLTVDMLLGQGAGTWTTQQYSTLLAPADGWQNPTPATATLSWRAADVNGDGLGDLVLAEPTAAGLRVHTLLSTGNGTFVQQFQDVAFDASVPPVTLQDEAGWQPVADPDGRADLVHVFLAPDSTRVDRLVALGDGRWAAQTQTLAAPGSVTRVQGSLWRAADMNGDGVADLVRADPSATAGRLRVTTLVDGDPTPLLTQVANGIGGQVAVTYAPSSNWLGSAPPAGCALPNGLVVSTAASVTTSVAGSAGTQAETFSYGCPQWSFAQRRLLGWASVQDDLAATVDRPAHGSTRQYQLSDRCSPLLTQERAADGQGTLTTASTSYTGAPSCLPAQQVESRCDHGTDCTLRQLFYTYDGDGDLVSTMDAIISAAGQFYRETETDPVTSPGPYVVGLPGTQCVRQGTGPPIQVFGQCTQPVQPGVLTLTTNCYDGDCSAPPSKGLMTQTRQSDVQAGGSRTTTYAYDAFGNRVTTTDPLGHTSTTAYDGLLHVYPSSSCNALNQCSGNVWDPVLGRLQSVTDPNGRRTTLTYDALGRLTTMARTAQASLHVAYLDTGTAQQRQREWVDDGSSTGLWTERYFDGLGRTWLVLHKGETGTMATAALTTYGDASLQPAQQSHAFAVDATPPVSVPAGLPAETYSYDAEGRLLAETHPDGSAATWAYTAAQGLERVAATDELGHQRVTSTDAWGRQVQVDEDPLAGTPEPHPHALTTWTYDALGEVTQVVDSAGNATSVAWNSLGEKLSQTDPDLGTLQFAYDAAGNLASQVDARGTTTAFTYDALNRRTSMQWNPPGGQTTRWTYDESGHGASVGELTSVSDPSAAGCPGGLSQQLTYDAIGELAAQTRCVQGKSFTTKLGYDAVGRQSSVTYPDGQVVSYRYDAAGRLAAVSGYVSALVYDGFGDLVEADLGDGTVERYSYSPTRGWLSGSNVQAGGTSLFDESYQFQPNGLVSASTSTSDATNLGFSYDPLDRLTGVSGSLTQTFQYDATGNLVFNSAVGAYTYPAPGPDGCGSGTPCPHPHAVSSAGTATYAYDASGNMTSRAGEQIQWTPDDRPQTVTEPNGVVTSFQYDASGERVLQQVSVAGRALPATLYLGPLADYSTATGLRKYYYAGSRLIARSDRLGTFWFHEDRLGSTRLITDRQGHAVARYDYAPYGQVARAQGPGALLNDIGYTGGRMDASGLVYLNARSYDPRLGRFISADTRVPSAANPQALDRYTYGYDNPVSFVDPSGHDPVPVQDYSAGLDLTIEQSPPTFPDSLEGLTDQQVEATFFQYIAAGGFGEVVTVGGSPLGPPVAPLPPDPCQYGCIKADDGSRGMSVEDAQKIMRTYPGLTPELFSLQVSGMGVNAFWKWFSQFSMGKGPNHDLEVEITDFPALAGAVDARASELQAAIENPDSRGRVTMAVGLGIDREGYLVTLIGTNEGGYPRPGVPEAMREGEILAVPLLGGHAENNILEVGDAYGVHVFLVGAGRPICPMCELQIYIYYAWPASELKLK